MASDESSYPFLYSVALSNVQRLRQYTNHDNYPDYLQCKAEKLISILNHLPSIVKSHEAIIILEIRDCVYRLHDLLKENVDPKNWPTHLLWALWDSGGVVNEKLPIVSDEGLLKSSLSFKLPTTVKGQHEKLDQEVPLYLVPCLAYCALYPEGYRFVREILVNQWMAEGFLELQGAGSSSSEAGLEGIGNPSFNEQAAGSSSSEMELEDIEDIGNRYFNELLSIGVFVEPVYCFGGNGSNQQAPVTVHSCELQPESHKLACKIAGKEVLVITSHDYEVDQSTLYMALHKEVFLELLPSSITTCLLFKTCVQLRSVLLNSSELQTFEYTGNRYPLVTDLPESFSHLTKLRCVALSGCSRLKSVDWSSMKQLQTLAIDGCIQLEGVDLKHMSLLRHLYYTSSQTTLEIHTSSLRILQLSRCPILKSLSLSDPANFSSLRRLRIFECPSLLSLPDSINLLSRVEELVFHNCARLDLNCGRSMNSLSNLQHMELIGLPKLLELPSGLQTAKALNYLMIADCVSLRSTDPVMKHFHSLQKLCVYDCHNLSINPQEFQNLTALQSLDISRSIFKNGQDAWPFISGIPEIIVDGNHVDRNAGFGSQKSDDKKDSYSPMNFSYFIISLETFERNQSFKKGEIGEIDDIIYERYDTEKLYSTKIFRKVQMKRQINDKDKDDDGKDKGKAEDKDEGKDKGNAEVKDKGKGKAEDKDEGKARTGKITKGIHIK